MSGVVLRVGGGVSPPMSGVVLRVGGGVSPPVHLSVTDADR